VADAELSQAEADALLGMEKHRLSDDKIPFPAPGQNITVELRSTDKREEFLLDVWRSGKNPRRARFQIRARRNVVLARIDLGGASHRNLESEEDIPAPHLHLYREDWGGNWAGPAPSEHFTALDDYHRTLKDFMVYCNITVAPKFQWELL